MTVGEALANIDELKPNQISREIKVGWLKKLDKRIKTEVIDSHIGILVEDAWYEKEDIDETEELIAPDEFDEVYRWYLAAQIDTVNQEYDKYNVELVLFNQAWDDFASYINRNYLHKQTVHRGY